jgi:molybdopterin converting factor small subunit
VITLLFFAHLADQAKARLRQAPLAVTPQRVVEQNTDLKFLEDRSIRVAVNRRWAHWDTPLSDGDEIAFLPPLGAI